MKHSIQAVKHVLRIVSHIPSIYIICYKPLISNIFPDSTLRIVEYIPSIKKIRTEYMTDLVKSLICNLTVVIIQLPVFCFSDV